MENVPPFIVVTTIFTLTLVFLTFVLLLFGWLKVESRDVKRFIVVRGRSIAWSLYIVVAALFTIYFLFVLSLGISLLPFTISLVTFIVLVIWGLLGILSPAILKYFDSKRVKVGLEASFFSLVTLTAVLFWFVKYPEIQQPLFVTLLLVAVFVILTVHGVYKRIKAHKSK